MRRFWKTVRLVTVLGCACLGGAARLTADLAEDLARISVEETGGAKAHAALRSWRASGVTKIGEREVAFFMFAARPNSVRIESIGEKGSLVSAFDGVHAPWRKDDPLHPPRRMGREEEREFMLDSDFDHPLHDYEARRISLDYAGETKVKGRLCHKLLATVRFTDVLTLYIDDDSHLLVRRDETRRIDGKSVVLETYYSSFKKIAGVRLPRRIRTEVAGRVLTETVIEDYVPNPRVPSDFFSPPTPDWPLR